MRALRSLGVLSVFVLVGCGGGDGTTEEVPVETDTGVTTDSSSNVDSTIDSGAVDSGSADTSIDDTSIADSATVDGGSDAADTGSADTGSADTGSADTGSADTGAADTGAADTGAADTAPDATDSGADVATDVGTDAGPPVLGCGTNKWRAFASSAMYSGNLGGLVGADAKCQVLANKQGLAGAWKAWLSDGSASPSTRFNKSTTPYHRLDGTQIAASYTGLTSGSLLASISVDETGATLGAAEVWTGTSAGGTGSGGCNNWMATSGTTPAVGLSNATNSTWSNVYLQFCDRTNVRLYCFEQCPTTGVTDPGTGAATTGDKLVFVTSESYSGNLGGLVGADAKCQVLADKAGLGGTYKAFLSDATKSASSRMSKSTGSYKLKSGTVVAANATAFFSTTHAAAINQDETGTTLSAGAEVWTGTSGAGTGTGGCNNWTSTSGTTPPVGLSSSATSTWSNVYLQFCDRTNVRLYCVQQ